MTTNNTIDEKAVLEFCRWKQETKVEYERAWEVWIDSNGAVNLPDIYSLEWQDEHLWPILTGFNYCYSIELRTVGNRWRCQLVNVAHITPPHLPKRIDKFHEKLATAILLATQEVVRHVSKETAK